MALVATPVGAHPGVPTDGPLACLFEGITAEQQALAAPAASQRLTDGPADGEQRGGAALGAILASVPRCAAAGRWDERQRGLAEHYVLARLARQHMLAHYAAQGVDLSFIDEAVAAATTAPPPFDALVARVRAQGVTGERPDSAEDIVYIYLELAVHVAAIRGGFSDPGFNPR